MGAEIGGEQAFIDAGRTAKDYDRGFEDGLEGRTPPRAASLGYCDGYEGGSKDRIQGRRYES